MPRMQNQPLEHLIATVRHAAAQGTPLRICGGQTKNFWGRSLEGEPLSTSGLVGVVSYEPSELVVTVQAGTPLAELEALLAEHGQCLPFEPPHFGEPGLGTVGGMVAAGWAGPARASVGGVRDYVLGLKLVNGRGELLTFGGQVMKNVAGYDVSRLMAGAWGTLGLITEVSLKVLPVAPAEATLRLECSQEQALTWLHTWGAQPLPLNASCWVQDQGVGTLYLRLRGAVAAVESACRKLGGIRLDDAATVADWQACRDQRLPWFAQMPADHSLWRLSVPQTAPVLSLPSDLAPPLVEWHGGLRWVQARSEHAQALHTLALRAGGHAQLFRHGVGAVLAELPTAELSPPLDRIHQRLRAEFDPAGIFNRGRMVAGL